MQSQQKRVKWSRGETSEALEERTDTGITQASVELMENCIPDIYGNISRRPALKPIPYGEHYFDADILSKYYGFKKTNLKEVIPFYISENDYILIGIYNMEAAQFIRIKDGVCVYKTEGGRGILDYNTSLGLVKSYAQQNNYLIVAGEYKTVKITIYADLAGYSFDVNVEYWEYTAGWYAPNGTQTKSISSSDVSGLNFQANSLKNYVFTESNGQSIVYSSIKTGITLASITGTWSGATTTFYVHRKALSKCYIDLHSHGAIDSFTMTNNNTYNNKQTVKDISITVFDETITGHIKVGYDNKHAYFYFTGKIRGDTYDISSYMAHTPAPVADYIDVGSIVQFVNNGAYMRVEGFDSDGTDQIMYGSLLTPVADSNATDTEVNVEYGYISLTPLSFAPSNTVYPHPEQLCFQNQRLWAGSWLFYDSVLNQVSDYAIILGSQIARYNDFKNDYNQENEPITLDILTSYKEKIVHLIDYNGLKIFTNSFEYIYENGGVVKQSANGALESCKPIVFESLCLYADKTGNQIRAMQYEFQSNIFNSSCINQLAPHDLVWYPIGMAGYEDKVYSTGKYLFIANTLHDTTPTLAVCNFVPSNQANIWSRWTIPERPTTAQPTGFCGLFNVLDLKGNVIFLIKADSNKVIPCMLDFTGNVDLEGTVDSATGDFNIAYDSVLNKRLTLYNMPVAVYSNGEFKFATTTDANGKITDDLSGLTNITAGLMINSKIVSHPIDVGGKTKSVKKRIGKAQMSVHDTEAGAITINNKTGYMNPRGDHICFYGVSGMKDEVKYTITNKNGAMFHLESLLMNIEYGTLDS